MDFGVVGEDIPSISVEPSLDSSRFSIDLTSFQMTDATHNIYGPVTGDFAGNQYQVQPETGFGTWPTEVE